MLGYQVHIAVQNRYLFQLHTGPKPPQNVEGIQTGIVLEDLGRSGAKTGTKQRKEQRIPKNEPGKCVSQDSGNSAAEADHQQKDIRTRKQAQAGDGENQTAGEVRFGGFGSLKNQNSKRSACCKGSTRLTSASFAPARK